VLTNILAARIDDAAGKQERAWKMQSTMMTLVRQRGCATKAFCRVTCAIVTSLAAIATPVSALAVPPNNALQFKQDSPITEVVVRRGSAARHATIAGPSFRDVCL
jgi:hypothetical protein